jgi:hypothetical protein
MANLNPYTDFKLDPGVFGGSSFESSWKPDSGSWNKAFNSKTDYSGFGKYTDPFGLNKDKDKKESPWGDVARFAGKQIQDYAQSKSNQGGGFAGGGGGVFQSGDLTFVYPQSPTVIPGQKGGLGSTIGSIAGAALGTLIAPGIGTTIGGQLGGLAGGEIG